MRMRVKLIETNINQEVFFSFVDKKKPFPKAFCLINSRFSVLELINGFDLLVGLNNLVYCTQFNLT